MIKRNVKGELIVNAREQQIEKTQFALKLLFGRDVDQKNWAFKRGVLEAKAENKSQADESLKEAHTTTAFSPTKHGLPKQDAKNALMALIFKDWQGGNEKTVYSHPQDKMESVLRILLPSRRFP